MGSVGDCYDNAVCETFHATLKKERIYRQSWPTRATARTAIFEYIPAKIDPSPGQYVNGDQYSLVLTAHTLYVGNAAVGSENVWATPIPTAPPPKLAKRDKTTRRRT